MNILTRCEQKSAQPEGRLGPKQGHREQGPQALNARDSSVIQRRTVFEANYYSTRLHNLPGTVCTEPLIGRSVRRQCCQATGRVGSGRFLAGARTCLNEAPRSMNFQLYARLFVRGKTSIAHCETLHAADYGIAVSFLPRL